MGHQSTTESDDVHHDHGFFNRKGEENNASMAKPSMAESALANPTEWTSSLQDTFRNLQGTLLADWESCTSSSSCLSGCCTAMYSPDQRLQCIPRHDGIHSDICLGISLVVTQQLQEATTTPTTTTNSPSTIDATCGYGHRGNGVCPDGTCCSQFGWCGARASICDDDDHDNPVDTGLNATVPPTSSSQGIWCGNGEIGNGICPDGTCCSKVGWCGTTALHCSKGGDNATLSPGIDTCGYGEIGNGICPDGACCSKFGWCGTTANHCSKEDDNATLLPVNGTCGYGEIGNGICPDGTCCSKYGWCGTTADHCFKGDDNATLLPAIGTCGYGEIGNGICPDGTCCSKFGWCGTTADHCFKGDDNETSLPVRGTCGEGEIGDGICPDGTCCSEYGWCGIAVEHCQSRAPSMAPTTINVQPGGGGKLNETLPTSSPIGTPSSQQQVKNQGDRNLVYVLLAVVILLFIVILVQGTGIVCKFWTCKRPAAVGTHPEGQKEPPPGKKGPALEEPSIADDSLYTTTSRKWTTKGFSFYVSRPSHARTSETRTSMDAFSSSGLSWPSMVDQETRNDELDPNFQFHDVEI